MRGNITAPAWDVDDFAQIEGKEFPHTWKEATALQWHIHLITNGVDTSDRYVKFEIEYCWANPMTALSSAITITSAELLIPANTTDRTHMLFNIGSAWTPTAGTIGAMCFARLKRVASVGTAPTEIPFVHMAQLHIMNDTMGSRTITAK
jgi:hypothetical protein